MAGRQRTQNKQAQNKMKTFTYKMRAKLVFVFLVIIIVFLAVVGRLLYLSRSDGTRYAKSMLSQQTYVSSVIPYKRGSIMDRKGTVFAVSEKVYNLILEPKTILSKKEYYKQPTFAALTAVFGFSAGELEEILTEKPSSLYVVLKKEVTYEEMVAFGEVEARNKKRYVQGVWFEEQYRRIYPLGTVGSDLIGFTSSGNVGNWGIEGYYNDELNGTNGRKYGYFDADLNLEETVKGAVNGHHVVSTLDADAQRTVEKIIAEYMETEGAENVGVILMDPNTGEIYAMASDQGYDLNNPRDLSGYYTDAEIAAMSEEEKLEALNQIWRNYCISDAYEPGSTFKPFTVAASLEERIAGRSSEYVCQGYETIAGRDIGCVKRTGHGSLSLKESLMYSCNAVMMQISGKLGRAQFDRYQRLFGIGSKTGIDLPGEGYGLTFDEEKLNAQELATSSFGQGLAVTMIQMVGGFSSLINGGFYYQPHVMKELTNDSGLTVEEYTPVLMKKTVTKETSDFIREALYATVQEGTAKKAQAAGFQVGGKTGTAEKHPRGNENYVVSFLGFAPYENPEIVVYVVIDQPHVEDQTKCTSASEMASRIITEVFPILGVYPTEPVDTNGKGTEGQDGTGGETNGEGTGGQNGTAGETNGGNGESDGGNGASGGDGADASQNGGTEGADDGSQDDGAEGGQDDGRGGTGGSDTDGDGTEEGGTSDEPDENEDATHIYD